MTETVDLDRIDRAVVNGFQGGFPIVEHPFEPAASALVNRGIGVTAGELLERIQLLDDRGVLTRFGPLINAEAIGGAATLVAMQVPPERFDAVADQVNDHREVAHNYERSHQKLNMWFVISVADPPAIDRVLDAIEVETGLETYNLPKKREFRVEAKFYVEGPDTSDIDLTDLGPEGRREARRGLTASEADLLLEVQDGLPLTETPYRDVADTIDRPLRWVLETLTRFDREGKIRRLGCIPNHYALGYTENGMTVWDVPDGVVGEVGAAVASLDFVTHCYERPRHEGVWPYNFFAMVHGRNEDESDQRVQAVREVMGQYWTVNDDAWDTLFSTSILKKTGIRFDERVQATIE